MEQETVEKAKRQIMMRLIPILLFILFLFLVMLRSISGEVKDAITETHLSIRSVENLTDSFENTLQENISGKNEFININGLTTRVLGVHTLNERYKLANGYLARTDDAQDITKYAESVVSLNTFLRERGIEFLYLQAPSKEAFWDAEYLPGYSSDGWKTIDNMVSSLTNAGVNTLDANAWFKENGWTMEDTFFKTDHHWLPSAALAIAGYTMEILEQNGGVIYDKESLSENNYTVTVLENWFLGSHGKRVGKYYAGVDDFEVFVPNFATDYAYAGLTMDTTNWDYSNSLLELSYMEKKDYFGQDTHAMYLYGEKPLQIIRNAEAINNKRILIYGDSFRREWQYFLSTQFQEVYSVGSRSYSDGTFVEYVEDIQPDIVIMCMNTSQMAEEAYSFGVDEYLAALNATSEENAGIVIQSDIFIPAQEENAENFMVLYDNLESGQTYTVTLDSTTYTGGEDQFVQMTLQDLSTNTAICNRYFDANNEGTQKWIFTTPDEVNGNYSIYLYAGTKGHTADCSVKIGKIRLRRGLFEDN